MGAAGASLAIQAVRGVNPGSPALAGTLRGNIPAAGSQGGRGPISQDMGVQAHGPH